MNDHQPSSSLFQEISSFFDRIQVGSDRSRVDRFVKVLTSCFKQYVPKYRLGDIKKVLSCFGWMELQLKAVFCHLF